MAVRTGQKTQIKTTKALYPLPPANKQKTDDRELPN